MRTVSLLVGAPTPVPVPDQVLHALERVEVHAAIGERGTFRLTFGLDDPTLPERFLDDTGELLRVVLGLNDGSGPSVAMDGVMVTHTLTMPEVFVLEPRTKVVIPVPVPDIGTPGRPLGATVPPAQRIQRLRGAAKLTAPEAAGALLAKAARSAEAMTGHGELDIAHAGVRLRPGAIVEILGAAKPFDGLFEVSSVHDTVTAEHHRQTFALVRAGIGAAASGKQPGDHHE